MQKHVLLLSALIAQGYSIDKSDEQGQSHHVVSIPMALHIEPIKRLGCKPSHPTLNEDVQKRILLKKTELKELGLYQKAVPQKALPKIIELPLMASWTQNVYNQGDLGSCTANAMGFCIKFLTTMANGAGKGLNISRLYQYYHARQIDVEYENPFFTNIAPMDLSSDDGASLSSTVLAIDRFGCCPENINNLIVKSTYKGWPYDITSFSRQPDPESYRISYEMSWDGINVGTENFIKGNSVMSNVKIQFSDIGKKIQYKNVVNTNPLKFIDNINKNLAIGRPVEIGLFVYDSFMSAQKGWIPVPNKKLEKNQGGHAIALVGVGPYDVKQPQKNFYKFINSWGATWGDKGFGFLPEDFLKDPQLIIEAYAMWLS
jgi:hypothetical protein